MHGWVETIGELYNLNGLRLEVYWRPCGSRSCKPWSSGDSRATVQLGPGRRASDRPARLWRGRLDWCSARPLYRLEFGATPTKPPLGRQQGPLPDPALGRVEKPRFQYPRAGRPITAAGLEGTLWLSPVATGNLSRKRPLPRNLLPGRQLASCRPDPGAGQARPFRQTERPDQGRMAVFFGKRLQKRAG